MAGAHHAGGHIHHGGQHRALQHGLQPLGVVHAVLQAQHHSVGAQVRGHGLARTLGVGGFDAEQHALRTLHGAGLGVGLQLHALLEGLGVEQQAVLADGFDVHGARHQHHRVPGPGQHAAVVTAHGACAHDGDFHGVFLDREGRGQAGRAYGRGLVVLMRAV